MFLVSTAYSEFGMRAFASGMRQRRWRATETMAGDKAPTTKKKHDDDGRSKMVYHK